MKGFAKAALLAVTCLMCLVDSASAQLFPNAVWNKRAMATDDGCVNGQCPLVHKAVDVATVPVKVLRNVAKPTYSYESYQTTPSYGSSGSAGYGSSGSAAFGRDYDGAVITSVGVGVTIAPPLPEAVDSTASSVMSVDAQTLRIGDRVKFRRALLEAARKARDSGEITSLELFMLSAASRSPRVLEKMQAAVHEAAIAEGLATTQEIDWDGLITFIEKLIPVIIKLIDLFSYVVPTQIEVLQSPQYAFSPPDFSLSA